MMIISSIKYKIVESKQQLYNWLMNNAPFRLMYVEKEIDNQHTMWIPRWGWSKKQLEEAEIEADKIYKKLYKQENGI